MKRLTVCVVVIMLIGAAASLPFLLNAGFGQAPKGAQLSQVEQSPHYRDGQFHNRYQHRAIPATKVCWLPGGSFGR